MLLSDCTHTHPRKLIYLSVLFCAKFPFLLIPPGPRSYQQETRTKREIKETNYETSKSKLSCQIARSWYAHQTTRSRSLAVWRKFWVMCGELGEGPWADERGQSLKRKPRSSRVKPGLCSYQTCVSEWLSEISNPTSTSFSPSAIFSLPPHSSNISHFQAFQVRKSLRWPLTPPAYYS